MRLKLGSLLLFAGLQAAGCAPEARGVAAPDATVTTPDPQPPMSPDTAVKKLGVAEELITAPADEHRLWSIILAHETALARCLADDLEREPTLAGTASLSLAIDERGAHVTLDRETTLPALPSIDCVTRELEGIGPERAALVARYRLRLSGSYAPATSSPKLASTDVLVDSLGKPGAPVPDREALTATLSKAVGRCMREGDAPAWIVGQLGTDQKLEVARGRKAPSAAERCIARALANGQWPSVREPIAFSALFTGPPEANARQAEPARQPESQMGVLVGNEMDDTSGVGGLGTGGGTGIGLGSLGTIGHGPGPGSGQGSPEKGRLGGEHRERPAKIKMGGTSVAGRLPPEVIQRIVRQNFGHFRICYEKGLEKNPKLSGAMRVSFTIGVKGDVTDVKDSGNLKDAAVTACVIKAFRALTFPAPEGGVVKVTYPIAFSAAGEEDKPTAAPEPANTSSHPFTVDGKTVADLTTEGLLATLEKLHMEPRFAGRLAKRPDDPLVMFVRRPNGKVVLLHRMADGSTEAKAAMAAPEAFQKSGGALLFAKSSALGAAVATLNELAD